MHLEMQKVLETNQIPIQMAASSRSTGTDTDAFAYSDGCVPSALILLPMRYIHTTVEKALVDYIEIVVKLIYNTLLDIEAGQRFRYFEEIEAFPSNNQNIYNEFLGNLQEDLKGRN
jgi:putative aminopeptidase FrvX